MSIGGSVGRWARGYSRHWKVALLCAAVAALAAGGSLATWIALPLPAGVLRQDAGASVRIEDRSGRVLRSTRAADGTDATWVAYGDIDPDVINAFVATEDRRFWEHHGVDFRSAARAAWSNVTAGRTLSGASTLTMPAAARRATT